MTWKQGKRWVYSINYDEGCVDLLKFALPLHHHYGIPGRVALLPREAAKPPEMR
jgi:hypothetical protein